MNDAAATQTTGPHCGTSCRPPCNCPGFVAPWFVAELEQAAAPADDALRAKLAELAGAVRDALACDACGVDLPPDDDGMYEEGAGIECAGCRALNVVGLDEAGRAYVVGYMAPEAVAP